MMSEFTDNKIVLLARDPWWIFSYWHLSETDSAYVLRVYDMTGFQEPSLGAHFFDIEVSGSINRWTIDAGKPDTEWIVEIGRRSAGGKFVPLCRSNRVRTPRAVPAGGEATYWMESSYLSSSRSGHA